jgi:cytochrome c553
MTFSSLDIGSTPAARGWFLVALLCACAHTEGAQPSSESGAARRHTPSSGEATPSDTLLSATYAEGKEPDRAHHMQATFWLAVEARNAIISGDLEAAKRAALTLEQHDYSGTLPESWKHWVKQMQKEAGNIAAAGTLSEAAQAVAALSLTCGDCHAQKQQGPDRGREQPMPWRDPPDTVHGRMARHEVGVDQLWSGLVIPSEDSWRAGSVTFTRAPLTRPEQDGTPMDPELARRTEEVRAMAQRARAAKSHAERAQVYGELLSTCGACHRYADVAIDPL